MNYLSNLFPLLGSVIAKHPAKPKTHDYTRFVYGSDYVFEIQSDGQTGYITGYGRGIKIGDYLILKKYNQPYRYQVKEIEYYANPSDMWMALLKEVPGELGVRS